MLPHQARQAYHAAIALGLHDLELLGSADESGAATGEDGDVLEHLFAAVAEAGKLSIGFAPLLLNF